MSNPHELRKLTRWVEGGAIAALVSAATFGVPAAMFLVGGWSRHWYAAPCASGFFILLALMIDLRSRRRAQAPQMMHLAPDVLEAAHERFTVPGAPEAARGRVDAVKQPLPGPERPRAITSEGPAG